MGPQDNTALDLDRSQPVPKEGPVVAVNGAIAEVRATAARHLGELMQRLWAIVDDQLFNLSGQAGSASLESDYFLAMRLIRREASGLRANYEAAVLRQFDEFWKKRPMPATKREGITGGATESEDSQWSLVAEDVLEEQLAISGIVEKAKALFQRELYTLDARFAHLAGCEAIEAEVNPLGPSALCLAFAESLQPLPLHLAVKLLIYKLFEQAALRMFGSLYGELNAYLIRAGVLPQLAWSLKRANVAGAVLPAGSESAHGRSNEGRDDNYQAYVEVFESMQCLLNGWRSRMGLQPSVSAGFTGPALAPAEVLSVLGTLQNVAELNVDDVKAHVRRQIRKSQPDGGERPLGRREEDVIDMVSLVFDYILEDPNLPDAVKALIVRLQIPVIKVAIMERAFFGRKNHPARLLLNALAQAGIGLDMEDGGRENPVFKRIEGVVKRVQDEFGHDVNLFSDLLDEFTAFMEKESQRTRIAEERTLQATHSKERVRLCKRKVAYEIASRLQGKTVAAPVRSFLFNTWKDVMVLAYLRRDRAPEDWGQCLRIMDSLIWTTTVPIDPASRDELIQGVPALLKSIKEGLEALSLDPQAVAETLRDLQACQSARLLAADAGWGVEGRQQAAAPVQKVEIRDPELAQAIVEIRDSLPEVEGITLTDLAGPLSDPAAEAADPVPDEILAKTHGLAPGQWMEFIENGKRLRAKLSWKSQTTTTHVFVNRKGAKVIELSLVDLAQRLAGGRARVVEGASIPLMDRALEALMNTLRGPLQESIAHSVG
jgi:hypothetical protein